MTLPDRLDPDSTAFFLDFDGTLVDIVARPQDVVLEARTRAVLGDLMALTGGAVALVSGRELADLDALVAPLELPAAGSHGSELRLVPGGPVDEAEGHAALHRAEPEIGAFAEAHGLLLERKRGALSLHYRSHPELEEEARALVARLAEGTDELRTIDGNMITELALAGFDKGKAVARMLASPPFAGRTPLVAGDDTTDEDAFAEVLRRGGIAIKVGRGETCAGCRAADTGEFLDWLAEIARDMRGDRA